MRPAWPLAQWRAFDAAGIDQEFFAGTTLRSILVVNIAKPADGTRKRNAVGQAVVDTEKLS